MRSAIATVSFDFEFKYPAKGAYEFATAITVCEPNWDKRQVYRKMHAYVAEAQKGMLKMFTNSDLQAQAESSTKTDDSEPGDIDPLQIMRMGLGVEMYPTFVEWLTRELTNSKALAFVGTDTDARIPVTEEVWMNLEEAGGMEAVDKVVGAFAGFFMGRDQSTKPSGIETRSGSPATPAARSRSRAH